MGGSGETNDYERRPSVCLWSINKLVLTFKKSLFFLIYFAIFFGDLTIFPVAFLPSAFGAFCAIVYNNNNFSVFHSISSSATTIYGSSNFSIRKFVSKIIAVVVEFFIEVGRNIH